MLKCKCGMGRGIFHRCVIETGRDHSSMTCGMVLQLAPTHLTFYMRLRWKEAKRIELQCESIAAAQRKKWQKIGKIEKQMKIRWKRVQKDEKDGKNWKGWKKNEDERMEKWLEKDENAILHAAYRALPFRSMLRSCRPGLSEASAQSTFVHWDLHCTRYQAVSCILWTSAVYLPRNKGSACLKNGCAKGEEATAAKCGERLLHRNEAVDTDHRNRHGIEKGIDDGQKTKWYQAIGASGWDGAQFLFVATATQELPKIVLKQTQSKEDREEIVGGSQGIALPTPSQRSSWNPKNTDPSTTQPLHRFLAEFCPSRQWVHAWLRALDGLICNKRSDFKMEATLGIQMSLRKEMAASCGCDKTAHGEHQAWKQRI